LLAPNISVDVEDAYGNVVASNGSTVTLTWTSYPKGGITTTTATAKTVNGVAAFAALTLKVAGSYAFKVTDGSLTAAYSKTIAIVAAAAAKLVIVEQPTTGTHGVSLSPVFIVDVEDAFGNIVLTDASSVALAIAPGSASGALTTPASVKAVKGIAKFGALALSKAGTYYIKATDGKLTAALSKSVVVK
jgi:hypothetical protein